MNGVTTTVREFEPDLKCVREARHFAQITSGCDAAHPLALCVSELATNAVLHARTHFTVTVARQDAVIRVEVSDQSDSIPGIRQHSPLVAHGRGLQIVASLADRWGVERLPSGGKTVWFEVERTVSNAG